MARVSETKRALDCSSCVCVCVLKFEASACENQSVQTPPGSPERGAGSPGQPPAVLRGDQESPGQAVGAPAQRGLPKGQELPPRSVTSADVPRISCGRGTASAARSGPEGGAAVEPWGVGLGWT